MAEVITQIQQPPEFIEAAAKPYITELQQAVGGFKGADLSKVYGPQFVAGMDPLQQRAIKELEAGIGGYQPFIQEAQRLAGTAETGLGAAAGDIAAARGMIGPQAYQQFMSPYQQDVIDATLREYDLQAQRGLTGIAERAIASGAFGGGREGVERAEFQSASDRNRAALQTQLLQQGFGQAQQLAQTAQQQRMGVGAAQAGLAQQRLGLGQFQTGLASQVPGLRGQDVAGLSTLGAGVQAQRQSELGAQQQLAQQQLMQPITAAQTLGTGIMGLISGYPGGTSVQTAPSPSPLQSALGLGATLAGIYRAF